VRHPYSGWKIDMTIAMAAVTNPEGIIVCVSDRMISYGDFFPAEDNAIVKAIYLYDQWTCAFATNSLPYVLPIIEETRKRFKGQEPLKLQWDGTEAAAVMAEAYSDFFQKEFVARYLSRFGYKTMDEFRQSGRHDLGEHFTELSIELGRFDLQTSFLLFGHDRLKQPKLYQIDSPGRVVDCNALKMAVIGSGHDMAMASLRWPPPLTHLLEDTIYRLLEAKFASETATGVGKTTTVALRNREGRVSILTRDEVDAIREIWRKDVADVPSPPSAIELLEKSHAVEIVAGQR
jgi:hypothetical protein